MIDVSAIVSAYFSEEYIDSRLENLMRQSARPEIIVVCQQDSPEYSAAIRAQVQYARVVIIPTEDIPTVYTAWNLGIERARGCYITNANTDDTWYPGGLERLVKALDEHPDYAIAYAYSDIEKKGEIIGRFEWLEGGLEDLVMRGCFLGPMPVWRKSLHATYGMFDGEMHSSGDYEFWMRLAHGSEKFILVPESLGLYQQRDKSLERREKLRSIWETSRARARYREALSYWQKPYTEAAT